MNLIYPGALVEVVKSPVYGAAGKQGKFLGVHQGGFVVELPEPPYSLRVGPNDYFCL